MNARNMTTPHSRAQRVVRQVLGAAEVDCPVADGALTVLRMFAGFALAFGHGLGKLPPSEKFVGVVSSIGFPAPGLFAWAAALSEFGGGLLLGLGLLTRPAATLVCFTMLVAVVGQHRSDPFKAMEPALLYGAIALVFVLLGSSRFGLDRLARRALGFSELSTTT
jgi:putative oxidoreductase